MTILVLGLVLFIGAHVFVTLRAPRAAIIARIGEWPYKAIMGLVSLVGIILIGYGFGEYRAAGWVEVWHPPRWTFYITQILMWPASICVVAAYSRGNIWRRLKHPMLVGVKTFAVAHLIANGDLGSIVLNCCQDRLADCFGRRGSHRRHLQPELVRGPLALAGVADGPENDD